MCDLSSFPNAHVRSPQATFFSVSFNHGRQQTDVTVKASLCSTQAGPGSRRQEYAPGRGSSLSHDTTDPQPHTPYVSSWGLFNSLWLSYPGGPSSRFCEAASILDERANSRARSMFFIFNFPSCFDKHSSLRHIQSSETLCDQRAGFLSQSGTSVDSVACTWQQRRQSCDRQLTNPPANQSIFISMVPLIHQLAPIKWRLNDVFLFKKPTSSSNWLLLTIFPPESLGPFFKHLIWHLLSHRSMWTQRAAEKMIWCSD